MKSNILAFFLSLGSIGLAVLIVWFYNMSDREAPEMRFMAMDLTYDSATTEQDLLGGVMAHDVVDGDITDRVVVEKTILDEEQGTAVVYYAVSDLSGNVTKQSRVFPADIDDLNGVTKEEMDGQGIGLYTEGSMFGNEYIYENTGDMTDGDGAAAEGDADGSGTQDAGNAQDNNEGATAGN